MPRSGPASMEAAHTAASITRTTTKMSPGPPGADLIAAIAAKGDGLNASGLSGN